MTFPEVETTFAWVESVMNRVKIPPTLCRSYFTTFSVASYKHSARFAHLYVSIAILGTKHAFPVSISMLNQEQLFGIKLLQETCFGAFKSTIETSTVLNSSLTSEGRVQNDRCLDCISRFGKVWQLFSKTFEKRLNQFQFEKKKVSDSSFSYSDFCFKDLETDSKEKLLTTTSHLFEIE